MILGKARAASKESAPNWDCTCGINKGNILPNVRGGFKMNRERRRNIFCKILKPKKNKNEKKELPFCNRPYKNILHNPSDFGKVVSLPCCYIPQH